ncbi:ORF72 [Silurid herpesvirus 1]|nr:ORF72 [Silurid herpesvirus 1]
MASNGAPQGSTKRTHITTVIQRAVELIPEFLPGGNETMGPGPGDRFVIYNTRAEAQDYFLENCVVDGKCKYCDMAYENMHIHGGTVHCGRTCKFKNAADLELDRILGMTPDKVFGYVDGCFAWLGGPVERGVSQYFPPVADTCNRCPGVRWGTHVTPTSIGKQVLIPNSNTIQNKASHLLVHHPDDFLSLFIKFLFMGRMGRCTIGYTPNWVAKRFAMMWDRTGYTTAAPKPYPTGKKLDRDLYEAMKNFLVKFDNGVRGLRGLNNEPDPPPQPMPVIFEAGHELSTTLILRRGVRTTPRKSGLTRPSAPPPPPQTQGESDSDTSDDEDVSREGEKGGAIPSLSNPSTIPKMYFGNIKPDTDMSSGGSNPSWGENTERVSIAAAANPSVPLSVKMSSGASKRKSTEPVEGTDGTPRRKRVSRALVPTVSAQEAEKWYGALPSISLTRAPTMYTGRAARTIVDSIEEIKQAPYPMVLEVDGARDLPITTVDKIITAKPVDFIGALETDVATRKAVIRKATEALRLYSYRPLMQLSYVALFFDQGWAHCVLEKPDPSTVAMTTITHTILATRKFPWGATTTKETWKFDLGNHIFRDIVKLIALEYRLGVTPMFGKQDVYAWGGGLAIAPATAKRGVDITGAQNLLAAILTHYSMFRLDRKIQPPAAIMESLSADMRTVLNWPSNPPTAQVNELVERLQVLVDIGHPVIDFPVDYRLQMGPDFTLRPDLLLVKAPRGGPNFYPSMERILRVVDKVRDGEDDANESEEEDMATAALQSHRSVAVSRRSILAPQPSLSASNRSRELMKQRMVETHRSLMRGDHAFDAELMSLITAIDSGAPDIIGVSDSAFGDLLHGMGLGEAPPIAGQNILDDLDTNPIPDDVSELILSLDPQPISGSWTPESDFQMDLFEPSMPTDTQGLLGGEQHGNGNMWGVETQVSTQPLAPHELMPPPPAPPQSSRRAMVAPSVPPPAQSIPETRLSTLPYPVAVDVATIGDDIISQSFMMANNDWTMSVNPGGDLVVSAFTHEPPPPPPPAMTQIQSPQSPHVFLAPTAPAPRGGNQKAKVIKRKIEPASKMEGGVRDHRGSAMDTSRGQASIAQVQPGSLITQDTLEKMDRWIYKPADDTRTSDALKRVQAAIVAKWKVNHRVQRVKMCTAPGNLVTGDVILVNLTDVGPTRSIDVNPALPSTPVVATWTDTKEAPVAHQSSYELYAGDPKAHHQCNIYMGPSMDLYAYSARVWIAQHTFDGTDKTWGTEFPHPLRSVYTSIMKIKPSKHIPYVYTVLEPQQYTGYKLNMYALITPMGHPVIESGASGYSKYLIKALVRVLKCVHNAGLKVGYMHPKNVWIKTEAGPGGLQQTFFMFDILTQLIENIFLPSSIGGEHSPILPPEWTSHMTPNGPPSHLITEESDIYCLGRLLGLYCPIEDMTTDQIDMIRRTHSPDPQARPTLEELRLMFNVAPEEPFAPPILGLMPVKITNKKKTERSNVAYIRMPTDALSQG